MRISKRHRILIATDGSPPAHAAIETAIKMPWSDSSRVRAVVARTEWLRPDSEAARAALSRNYEQIAGACRKILATRWKQPDLTIVDQYPIDAILTQAQQFNATAIVLGWRGHGTFQRLLAGSVSRAVAARAPCAVLVVREAPRAVRRFVLALDGSPNAERAVDFLCSLEPKRRMHVTLVSVVEPVSVPASASLLPASARGHIRREVKDLNQERSREGQAALNKAVSRLNRCGWSAKGDLRIGAPLERLLSAVDAHRADVLVLGARAVSGLERALLGSVANGAVNRSRVPVLLVR
jgi:nucleotide-binding universal stress UspA family protein